MRIPRKLKKKIPVGHYCYTPVEFPSEKNNFVYKIKKCPFYSYVDGIEGYCKLLKCEVEDQTKSCSFKYGRLV